MLELQRLELQLLIGALLSKYQIQLLEKVNNLEIFSIVLLFQNQGACLFHSDPEVHKRTMDELNQLDKSKFDHKAFNKEEAVESSSSTRRSYD